MAKKPAAEPQGITFTMESFQAMLDAQQKQMVEFAKELKRLPAHEQELLDKKLEQERQARVSRAREAVQDERLRRSSQFYCPHFKAAEGTQGAGHAFRGQVNNDNCCRAVCIRCTKIFPPFKVTQENLKTGMSLQNLKSLTATALWQAHMQSFPDCKECSKGGCAVKDLREFKSGKMDDAPVILPDGKISAEQLTA